MQAVPEQGSKILSGPYFLINGLKIGIHPGKSTVSFCHLVTCVRIWSFVWSLFPCIRTEYADMQSKYPCSVWLRGPEKLRIRINSEQVSETFTFLSIPFLLMKSNVVISLTLLKKWSFPLRISSVNVTKSAGNC